VFANAYLRLVETSEWRTSPGPTDGVIEGSAARVDSLRLKQDP